MLGALQASGSDSSDPMGGEGKGKVGYSGRGMLQYSLEPEHKPSEQEAVLGRALSLGQARQELAARQSQAATPSAGRDVHVPSPSAALRARHLIMHT